MIADVFEFDVWFINWFDEKKRFNPYYSNMSWPEVLGMKQCAWEAYEKGYDTAYDNIAEIAAGENL
jgi:hypothetical protein